MKNKYFGKYRAIVVDNDDPEKWGRIKVKCPKLLGEYKSAWCVPCVNFLGEGEGILKLPRINDGVWIEFEEGDLDKPIWVGGWSTPENTPFYTYKRVDDIFMLRTKNGHKIEVDNKGSIKLELWGGMGITVDAKKGIIIKGDVKVSGEVTPNSDV